MARSEHQSSTARSRLRLVAAGVVGAAAVAVGAVGLSAIGGASNGPASPPATEPVAPHFPDGPSASAAAQSLIGPYIVSTYGTVVSDVACSTPPTGAAGDQFICYGMKPGSLVIALQATIGADLTIALEVLIDQQPAPPPASSEAVVATTTQG